MKLLALITIALLANTSVFAHEGHHHGTHTQEAKEKDSEPTVQKTYAEIQVEYLKSVKPIFDAKCAACHSTDVAAPWYAKVPLVGWIIESDRSEAKEHLEISKGFPFAGHGTPKEDLDAIEKVVSENDMPTFLYKLFHPSSKLTGEEKEALAKWAKSSRLKIADTESKQK